MQDCVLFLETQIINTHYRAYVCKHVTEQKLQLIGTF